MMRTIYENTPSNQYIKNFSKNQLDEQCKYLWGIVLDLLYKQEAEYPFLDNRIQSVINIVSGCNTLFCYSPKVITICAHLEKARVDNEQFRKCIMDSLGVIDELRTEFVLNGGDTYV